jgi:hypothetical protein
MTMANLSLGARAAVRSPDDHFAGTVQITREPSPSAPDVYFVRALTETLGYPIGTCFPIQASQLVPFPLVLPYAEHA